MEGGVEDGDTGMAKPRMGAEEPVEDGELRKCVFGPHSRPPFTHASHFTPGQTRGYGRHWTAVSITTVEKFPIGSETARHQPRKLTLHFFSRQASHLSIDRGLFVPCGEPGDAS
jgi:hypothetical protein